MSKDRNEKENRNGEEVGARPGQWLTMLDAAKLLSSEHAIPVFVSKDFILDFIATGEVELRCKSYQEDLTEFRSIQNPNRKGSLKSSGTSEISIELGVPVNESPDPVLLQSDFWLKGDGWVINQYTTDWESSMVTGERQLPACDDDRDSSLISASKRRTATGVEIKHNPSVFSLEPAASPEPVSTSASNESKDVLVEPSADTTTQKTRRGRPRVNGWDAWIPEVTMWLHENGMRIMPAAQFHREINDRILARDVHYEEVELATAVRTIGLIMDRWREELNKGEQ